MEARTAWLVIACSWSCMAGSLGMFYSWGVLYPLALRDYRNLRDGVTESSVAGASTIALGFFAAAGALGSRLVKSLGHKFVLGAGIFLVYIGSEAQVRSLTIEGLYVSFGCAVGTGAALVYLTAYTLPTLYHFGEWQGLATGVVSTGSMVGQLLVSSVYAHGLAAGADWRTMLAITARITAVAGFTMLMLLFMLSRSNTTCSPAWTGRDSRQDLQLEQAPFDPESSTLPDAVQESNSPRESLHVHSSPASLDEGTVAPAADHRQSPGPDHELGEGKQGLPGWLDFALCSSCIRLTIAANTGGLAVYTANNFLMAQAVAFGIDDSTMLMALAIMLSAAGIGVRLFSAHIAVDRLGLSPFWCWRVAIGTMGCVCLLPAALGTVIPRIAMGSFALCLGSCLGIWASFYPLLLAELFGKQNVTHVFGMLQALESPGMFAGPLIFGLIADRFGGAYASSWILIGVCPIIGAALCRGITAELVQSELGLVQRRRRPPLR